MIKVVKEHLEHYAELLDLNPVEFFMTAWEQNKLDRSDVGYMCAILYEAGIPFEDINNWREAALLQIIDSQLADWSLADGGVSAMPVYDFIQAFLNNCVGFDENYVLLFIKKHADRWDKYAELYVENNMTIIERR